MKNCSVTLMQNKGLTVVLGEAVVGKKGFGCLLPLGFSTGDTSPKRKGASGPPDR